MTILEGFLCVFYTGRNGSMCYKTKKHSGYTVLGKGVHTEAQEINAFDDPFGNLQ